MSVQNENLLRETLENYCQQIAAAVRVEDRTFLASIEMRLAEETTKERRELLTKLSERIGTVWGEFCDAFFDTLSYGTRVRAGLQQEEASETARCISSLSIVDDDQMEWDIALAGLGSRCAAAAGEALGEAEQRLDVLMSKEQQSAAEAGGVLDTGILVEALKHAFEQSIPEIEFRRNLLIWLDPILALIVTEKAAALNEALKDHGIDPAPRVRSAGAKRAAAAAAAAIANGDVFAAFQQLMQSPAVGGGSGGGGGGSGGSGGGGGGGFGGGGMPAGMVAVPASVLESLNRLQSLDVSAMQSGTALDSPPGTNVLRELRHHDSIRSLPPMEVATIDIVATLFDFIFDDASVPDSVKALVGRLQIPMLKVAMLDKAFFSNKDHPARALLNEISRASIAAGQEMGQTDPVYVKIKGVVNRVLNEFEKDQSVFVELLEEMRALVAEQEVRSEKLVEQSRQVAEQQEQSELAEIKAAEVFTRILEEGLPEDVPSHIGDFLSRKYPLVLKLALQTGGIKGAAWSLATKTLSDLLWSLTPKATPEDRQRLVAMLPDLLRRVNAFFDKVGVTVDEKAPFMDALVQKHSIVIKGVRRLSESKAKARAEAEVNAAAGSPELSKSPKSGSIVSQDLAPTVVVTCVVQENGVEVESMTVAGRTSGSRPIFSPEVDAIKRGDWVEFVADDGHVTRARLSWVSPQRGVMLFTNPQSSRAVSVSFEALALQLKRKQATILGAEPMVERAFNRALSSLKAA